MLDLLIWKEANNSDALGACEGQCSLLEYAASNKRTLRVVLADLIEFSVKLFNVIYRNGSRIVFALKHPNQQRAITCWQEELDGNICDNLLVPVARVVPLFFKYLCILRRNTKLLVL